MKFRDDPRRVSHQVTATNLGILQASIASIASSCGVVNRTSHPSGSSGNVTACSALAAALPQKHLGTVLRPIVWADQWLPLRGSKPMWLAIRAIHLLQVSEVGIRRGVQSDQVVHAQTRDGLAGRSLRYAKHLSTQNGVCVLSM